MKIEVRPCAIPYLDYLDIYSDGRVFNKKRQNFCTLMNHNQGYVQISAFKKNLDGKNKFTKYLVQRLVAITFIGDIPEKHVVNHIDGNKKNNHVSNLEIVTESENLSHAYKIGLRKVSQNQKKNFKENGCKYAKENFGNKIMNLETNEIYASQRECALALNISRKILATSLKNGNVIFPHLTYLKDKENGK
jgi:hypothetical protein